MSSEGKQKAGATLIRSRENSGVCTIHDVSQLL